MAKAQVGKCSIFELHKILIDSIKLGLCPMISVFFFNFLIFLTSIFGGHS